LFRNNFKLVLEDPFAKGCEGARVHGMEMNHFSCSMVFPLGRNSEGARAHEMEMNHMSCFNPTLHGDFQGQNCMAKPPQFYHVPAKIIETKISKSEAGEMVVLLCGTEMNHISCYMTVIILELQ